MTFNFYGEQRGGVVNNVAGDQTNIGGQQGSVGAGIDVRAAVADLRRQLDRTALPPAVQTAARTELEAITTEVHRQAPDHRAVAGRLTRLTELLRSAGALATAGAALRAPLATITSWLGAVGEPILRLLSS